ncbi:MAG: rRNA pseudouridine synthase [Myxococcales bacterium]|nr:rRNA pseudouridine synthase [Myxococcales bacterium]
MALERLQKILAQAGVASRRAAEALIKDGRVRVNGKVVDELGAKADPRSDRVEVDGKRLVAESRVYLVLHKPRGVVTTMSDPEGRPTVRSLLEAVGARVVPVGRLDFATSGALLVTNDGDFAAALLHPRGGVPKEYIVKVHGVMEERDLDLWRRGVELEDGKTLPAQAKLVRHEGDKTWFTVTLREGRNQQIRRMGEATGFPVMRLSRLSFAGVTTEGLAPGRYRALTRDELMSIRKSFGVPKKLPAPVDASVSPRPARPQPAARPAPRRDDRGRSAGTSKPSRAGGQRPTEGARYGGGAPVRRGVEVTEDWGGGVQRGRSSGAEAPPRSSIGSGRGGRTRTTGTGGGIGSREDAPRVRSRRGS